MALLRYDHVARLQYYECGGERLKHGKQRRSQDPPILRRRLNGSLVQDVLTKAASGLEDQFSILPNATHRVVSLGHLAPSIATMRLCCARRCTENACRLVELAIIDTNGSSFNDQIQLMRHAPHAQQRIGALTLEQCHNTVIATCHCVFPIRGDGNEFFHSRWGTKRSSRY
jgi:hypothetical protein